MKLKHPVYLPVAPTIAELERQARRVRLWWIAIVVLGCITAGILATALLIYS
jgi:hypothetical protein